MAAMVIIMVVFLVASGHHGFGSSHERDANRPAESAPHMQHDAAVKPPEEKP